MKEQSGTEDSLYANETGKFPGPQCKTKTDISLTHTHTHTHTHYNFCLLYTSDAADE